MGRELINVVPFWGLIALFMLFFLVLGYSSACISVYFYSRPIDSDHRKIANILIGILSGGFSILLAFVIINTWSYQLQSRLTTSAEADYISIMLHEVAIFPPKEKAKLTEAIRQYTVAVRVDEWKDMRIGKESQKAWDALSALYDAIQVYQPQTDQESLFYMRLVTTMNELLKSRRERLNGINSIIPDHLRASLIGGSIFLIIILGAIRGETNLFNLMPFLFFALILGFNLALALNFDYPYSGDITVSNRRFYSGVLGALPD